ncbi:MAG: hypothetical protein ABI972_26220 [Acidobacteriota bacterium]
MPIITPSPEQEASLLWAIELALDDQEHYLKFGNPVLDYADEWPEVAATKAEQLNNLAAICDQIGALQMATDARKLATAFFGAAQ